MEPKYWYIRMKHGTGGADHAPRLWSKRRVGIVYGGWLIEDVLANGRPDPARIGDLPSLQRPGAVAFQKRWVNEVRRFLCTVAEGDRVFTCVDRVILLGTITGDFCNDDEILDPEGRGERFKCRVVKDVREFHLAGLPASYRLLSMTGRGAVQEPAAFLPLIRLLDECGTAERLRERRRQMSARELLHHLAPEEWEVLCSEYLRDVTGCMPTLPIGRTLMGVDIVGRDRNQRRVVAQCKNNPGSLGSKGVFGWIAQAVDRIDDLAFYFARGGVKGGESIPGCTVVCGDQVADWLDANPHHLQVFRNG